MTPLVLFQYILAVICALALGGFFIVGIAAIAKFLFIKDDPEVDCDDHRDERPADAKAFGHSTKDSN